MRKMLTILAVVPSIASAAMAVGPFDSVPTKIASKADKADVDALNRLISEFSNELKQMRVDVDALKQDVASLNKRVNKADKEKWF